MGKGSFATVYKTSDGFAAKLIKKADLEGDTKRQKKLLKREIDIHRSISHPNIVKLYSVHETEMYVILKLELVEGH